MVPLYLDERMQASERRVARSFAEAAGCEFGPQTHEQLVTVPEREFLNSDYYNLLLRRLSIYDCVSLIPRLPNGHPVGGLKFYRRGRGARFRRDELPGLAALEPFLARLLQPRQSIPWEPGARSEPDSRALLVMTPDGRLLWQSADADGLLVRAFGMHRRPKAALPERLATLLDRLRRVRDGVPDAKLPQLDWHDDTCGAYSARATWMQTPSGEPDAVAVEVEYRMSRQLQLLKRLQALGLPDRQFEIAYWLAQHQAESQIAERVGISQNTLVYHRRRLYERLAVHSRQELLQHLSAETRPVARGSRR